MTWTQGDIWNKVQTGDETSETGTWRSWGQETTTETRGKSHEHLIKTAISTGGTNQTDYSNLTTHGKWQHGETAPTHRWVEPQRPLATRMTRCIAEAVLCCQCRFNIYAVIKQRLEILQLVWVGWVCACLCVCGVCSEVFMQRNPTASFWKTCLAMEPLTQILDLILMTKQLSQWYRAQQV